MIHRLLEHNIGLVKTVDKLVDAPDDIPQILQKTVGNLDPGSRR